VAKAERADTCWHQHHTHTRTHDGDSERDIHRTIADVVHGGKAEGKGKGSEGGKEPEETLGTLGDRSLGASPLRSMLDIDQDGSFGLRFCLRKAPPVLHRTWHLGTQGLDDTQYRNVPVHGHTLHEQLANRILPTSPHNPPALSAQ
jgi:hypothetical protein